MTLPEFEKFESIARLSRDIVITEKLDGTNAQIHIYKGAGYECSGLTIIAGSRNRWLTPQDDNYGFAKWVEVNKSELAKLGEGTHYGEWWGSGIQVGYGLKEKRFSLFNVGRWNKGNIPACVSVVPILYEGPFDTSAINVCMNALQETGSFAAEGFMQPEGVVIYHKHANVLFKKTLKNDEAGKSYGS